MELTSLHVLLTYRCNYECDHCFVWGSPQQSGVFRLALLEEVFQQVLDAGGIREFYFEGGEAFLYYPVLLKAISRAEDLGFDTGVVTNGYWATSIEDARIWLGPLVEAGLDKIEVSSDRLHGNEFEARHVELAALELGLAVSAITVNAPADTSRAGDGVMFRGRATVKLTADLPTQPWDAFTTCPYENLADPGRVHLDPFGNLHVCQGVVIGNLFERPLWDIIGTYDPDAHPIVGPLLAGGPAGLVRAYHLEHAPGYVDACHLCYTGREELRRQFPVELAPDQMYGTIAM